MSRASVPRRPFETAIPGHLLDLARAADVDPARHPGAAMTVAAAVLRHIRAQHPESDEVTWLRRTLLDAEVAAARRARAEMRGVDAR